MKNRYNISFLVILAILFSHPNLEAIDLLDPIEWALNVDVDTRPTNKPASKYATIAEKKDQALKKLTTIQEAIDPMQKALDNSSFIPLQKAAFKTSMIPQLKTAITNAFTNIENEQKFIAAIKEAWIRMRAILNAINPPIKEQPNLSEKEQKALRLKQIQSLSSEKKALLQQLNSISVPIFEISKIYNFDINKP